LNKEQKRILCAFGQFRKLRLASIFPGISFTDFTTLSAIYHNEKNSGCIQISKIAKILEVAPPAVSRSLKGLEDRNFIIRSIDKEDRRNIYVEITEEGIAILKETENIMSNVYENVYDKMGADEMQQMAHSLETFYDLCKAEIEKKKETLKGEKKDGKDF
jgi:DNA-binding MarR family transcriptional regulator